MYSLPGSGIADFAVHVSQLVNLRLFGRELRILLRDCVSGNREDRIVLVCVPANASRLLD